MTKILNKDRKSILLLVFLAVFGFSIGLFDNYRELWLSTNNIGTISISHIISISNIVTILVLLYFTLRVNIAKLKEGIVISLILKLVTSTTLICLNGTNYIFLIKLLMFFDIAFTQLIVSSMYPLMMSIAKSDLMYTKKDVVINIANKLGFLLASVMLGKVVISLIIDYNKCLLLSTIFTFIAFVILINIDIKSKSKTLNIDKALKYFKKNNEFILYLITCLISGIAWSSIIGLPMLTLTDTLKFKPNIASFFILGMGIFSNIMAIIILKYLRHRNDNINMIFKYGLRLVCYLLLFLLNNKLILVITFIYLLITDSTYGFIFDSYYINKVKEEYSLLMVVLKYVFSLAGNAIGVFICGLIFNFDIKYLAIPALVIGVIHYGLCTLLIKKKEMVK